MLSPLAHLDTDERVLLRVFRIGRTAKAVMRRFQTNSEHKSLPGGRHSEWDLDNGASAWPVGLWPQLEAALHLGDERIDDGETEASGLPPVEVGGQAAAVVTHLDPKPSVCRFGHDPDFA